MNLFKKCVLPLMLVLALVLSSTSVVSFAASGGVTVSNEADLVAAIDAIPVGGAGEITIKDVILGLSAGLYIEEKDVTLNLVNANISTSIDEYGYGAPVVFGFGANITINADEQSSMQAFGHTGNYGVVRVDNSTDWDAETETFEKDFTITINGGTYTCVEDDAVFAVASGTKMVVSDVVCNGVVEEIAFEGVGITVPGELTINSGKFSNDITEHVAKDRFCSQVGQNYYVREKEITDEFAKLLPNCEIAFNCAKPTVRDETRFLLAEQFNEKNPDFYFDPESLTDDFATCEIGYMMGTAKEEIHAVSISWVYDSQTKDKVDAVLEALPKGEDMGNGEYAPYLFKVTDLEVINYWLTCDEEFDNIDALIRYSDEFKQYIGYKNFLIDIRMGDGDYFYTFAGGIADFKYGDTIYAATHMEVQADHILYVPNETADSPDALLAAAQKRIDEYVGEGKVTLEYVDTVFAVLDKDHYTNTGTHLDPDLDLEMEPGLRGIGADDACFKATVNGLSYHLVIKRDSDRMLTPVYKSVDVKTEVSVSSSDASVPLDTVLKVEKLTDGIEYNRIIEILNVEDSETFDIQLHSTSVDQPITKLEDGKFEVRIPIPEKFKGKELVVYYVDENDTPIEYEVTVEEDFAVFLTDHFSIYTLTTVSNEHEHIGGVATCCAKAVCEECDLPYGELAPANHAGGTQTRNALAATEQKAGYSGDVYCVGCGALLETGKIIPASGVTTPDNEENSVESDSVVSPLTGDYNHFSLCFTVMLMSGGILLSIVICTKAKKNQVR